MLTTRRVFLQSATLGTLALPLLSLPGAAEPAVACPADPHPNAELFRFDRIIYDARRPEALAFGEVAASSGVTTRALSGDIGDACYEELRTRWRVARAPVAGMTEFRVLFLLQMMSLDAGLRPVMRVHHCSNGASVMHEAFGSTACRAASRAQLSQAGMQWGRAAARLVLGLPRRGGMFCAGDMNAANQRRLDSRALVTWAMA